MDKIENYRAIIIDKENDHYILLELGWDFNEQIYLTSFHIDIKNGKVWIQINNTDVEIAKELEELGIPKTDIVLGIQPPNYWKYTDYAVA